MSCIPLPPPSAPSKCLCCKQSFLPPFILVKSFQIYYVLTKLSVGPRLECRPGFVVALGRFFPPRLTFLFAIWLKKCTWHLYYSRTTDRSVHRAEPQTHFSCCCNSVADFCSTLQSDDPNFWVMGVFVRVGVHVHFWLNVR